METFIEHFAEPFKGKRITLMGLGMLGRGVGDAEFLATHASHIVITDKKTESELQGSVDKLKDFKNITFHLGGHHERDFIDTDLVIKAAGVPLESPEIKIAKKHNVPVAMSTALFAKYAMEAGAVVVGITGTRGKSTTTQMIYDVLQASGKKVLLGGNVRGVSTLALLPEVTPETICVLELDSWQLQGFGDLQISPNISVFTNLMPDHLNYYHGDMEKYFADKANIFRFQKEGDALFCGWNVEGKIATQSPRARYAGEPKPIPADWRLKILGTHNRENASFAAAVLRELGLSEEEIKNGLESFEGVEGRLQFVREINGVKIYNDNNATTPQATIAALESLGKNITLIIGGSEKDLPLEQLVSSIRQHVSHVILLTHEKYNGSTRLASELRAASVPFVEVATLQQAMDIAVQTRSTTILFSPAFASFGMFKNEYERGDEFLKIVRSL